MKGKERLDQMQPRVLELQLVEGERDSTLELEPDSRRTLVVAGRVAVRSGT